MNSGLNSDSKRCPESKLDQVQNVQTLDPSCAHATRALCRVAGAPFHVTAPTRALAHHVAGRMLRAISHIIFSRRAPCRVPLKSFRGAPCTVSWCLPRPCRACLAIQPSGQAAHASCRPYREQADRVVACLGCIVAALACTARPYRGLMSLLCHDTMHCIVTQARKMGNSPFQFLHCFFFHSNFFSFIPATGRPKKIIYIYIHVFSRTK